MDSKTFQTSPRSSLYLQQLLRSLKLGGGDGMGHLGPDAICTKKFRHTAKCCSLKGHRTTSEMTPVPSEMTPVLLWRKRKQQERILVFLSSRPAGAPFSTSTDLLNNRATDRRCSLSVGEIHGELDVGRGDRMSLSSLHQVHVALSPANMYGETSDLE